MGKGERKRPLLRKINMYKAIENSNSIVKETPQLSQDRFNPHVWTGLCYCRPELPRELLFYHTWLFTNMIFPNVISQHI